IAVMESPEMIDDVLLAQANAETTQRNSERFTFGMQQGTVTQIDTDNALSTAKQAKATLKRAQNLLGYTEVRAPFDGIVTARYVDPGALVPAATSATQQAQPVVDIADVDRVRVFFYLGQDTADFVKVGDHANLYEDERPGQLVPATVTRVSGALDPRTRTMQCEVDLDNGPWHLIPGTFVHVRLSVQIPPSPVVPDDALVTREGTTHVAVVDGDGHVHYRAIEVGTDDGRTMRVQSGLQGGETIGVNVPVEIEEGALVQPIRQKAEGGQAQGGAKEAPAERRPEPNVTPDNAADGGH
ncbi:MAG TPA: efflux RND transporter periplasmic adaptor subunit, partial [Polyangiaceae bacterium]